MDIDVSAVPNRYKTAPLAHQLEALRRARGKRGFMLSMEQGTGKTWVVINEMAELWGEGKLNGAIVFADNGVHTNWVEIELPKHMPDWVKWKARAWNANAIVKEQRHIQEILEGPSDVFRIFTVNWEALVAKRSLDFIDSFMNTVIKLGIVADESQGIANPNSGRTKNLEKRKMQGVYRRAMTGTPVLNGPFDLFAQYRFLDPTILKTTSFVAFKAEHADMVPPPQVGVPRDSDKKAYSIIARLPKGAPFPQIVDEDPLTGLKMYKNIDKLRGLVEDFTFRVLKKDCMDLPDKLYTQSFFELAPAQRKEYKRMAAEYRWLSEAGDEVPVSTKLVALGKLLQISSGFLMTEEGTKLLVSHEDNPKLHLLRERLVQSVRQFGKKAVVWYHHRAALDGIRWALKNEDLSFVEYGGDTIKHERTAAIESFQHSSVQVFVVQIQVGATGITLTRGTYVAYYENTFSYGDRAQSEDRTHRIGTEESPLYDDFIGHGTRDLKVVTVLREKRDLAGQVNGDDGGRALTEGAFDDSDIPF